MKRALFLSMALLIGILLPLQSADCRMHPWEVNPYDLDPGEDHPWGGDITDPGGVRIRPGGDNGYIQMSIIGRIVIKAMPIVMRMYTERYVSPTPVVQTPSVTTQTTVPSTRTIRLAGGK